VLLSPWKFIESNSALQGSIVGWTCCNVEEFFYHNLITLSNTKAFDKNALGCKKADKHLNDETYSKNVAFFPFDLNAAVKEKSNPESTQVTIKTETPTDKVLNPNYIEHTITSVDTLQGIALAYGISVSTLKRANMLTSHSIAHLTKILIPVGNPTSPPPKDQEIKKIQTLAEFQRKTGSSPEEAKYYLEDCDYEIAAALKQWREDNLWEKEHKKH